MFKLFELNNNIRKQVFEVNGITTVYEFLKYEIEYETTYRIDGDLFIEDVIIDTDKIEKISQNRIRTKPFKYFEDYFGFADISINNENLKVNILIEKLKLNEIEDLIIYLFDKNHLILSRFISKSTFSSNTVFDGKDYLISSKYVKVVEDFCSTFDELYFYFKKQPYSKIRKEFVVANYTEEIVDYNSVVWLSQNLDAVHFNNEFKRHPDHLEIDNQYGLLEKIGVFQNKNSYSVYENEIILGAFSFIKFKIQKIIK